MEKYNFVFFDSRGYRKKVFWTSILISLAGIGMVATGMGLTLFTVPKLPQIFLQAPKVPRLRPVFDGKEARFERSKNKLEKTKNVGTEKYTKDTKLDLSKQKTIGFVVNWDDTSFTSLQKN